MGAKTEFFFLEWRGLKFGTSLFRLFFAFFSGVLLLGGVFFAVNPFPPFFYRGITIVSFRGFKAGVVFFSFFLFSNCKRRGRGEKHHHYHSETGGGKGVEIKVFLRPQLFLSTGFFSYLESRSGGLTKARMNEKDENWKGRFGCLFIFIFFGLLIPPSLENKEVRGGGNIYMSLSLSYKKIRILSFPIFALLKPFNLGFVT